MDMNKAGMQKSQISEGIQQILANPNNRGDC